MRFVQSRPSDYRRLRFPSSLRVLADFRIWIALLVVCFVSTMHAQSDDFTLVVYPDTQNEAEFYPQVLNAQTQWVVDNRASWNIQAVLGVGDIVNDGASNAQWQNADAAIRLLDNANIPYLMAIGNHDYNGANAGASTRTATGFNQWFGPARYAAYSYYKGNYPSGSNENFYGVLNIGGVNYLFLVLEYIPRTATLNWAASIVKANPDKRIIIITHSNIYSDNTRGDQCDTNDLSRDNDGEETWAALTSQYANIMMVLSGHITGAGASRRADVAANGNLVNQMLSDYQTYPNGGNGYIRLLKFHPAQNTIDVYTYSPYIKGYKTDAANQFTLNIQRPTPVATGTTTISGMVRATRTGGACAVIAGAAVSFGTYIAASDSSGFYTLTIPNGPVNGAVSASAPGYNLATSIAYAAPGYAADVPLFLTPSTVPDYTVAATPAVQSVVQGGNSQSYSVNVTPSGGFTGNVSFSVSGLPAGTSASFSPNVIVTSGTSQMTVSTNPTAPVGAYALIITAASGSLAHTTNASITVTGAPNFSIAIAPNSQSVIPGGVTGSYNVSVTGQNGFVGSTSLSASGLPAGATASFDSNPVSAVGTSNLTVTTTASIVPGTYPFTITGSSGSLSHPVAAMLVVNSIPPPVIPDFTLSASPASVSVVEGAESAPLSITTSTIGGFTGDIILSTDGMPAGVTAIFDNSSPAAGSPSSLKFAVDATTAVGSYPIVVTGMSGSLSHIVNATLVVLQPPDFSLSIAPSSRSIAAGETSKNYLVTPIAARGFSGDVDLTVDGLPAGAAASLSTVTVPQGSSSNLQVSTDATVVPATYPLTITGTSGLLSHAATATLIVNPPATPDFDLAMSKQSVSVVQGLAASVDVTSSASGGFADGIDFSVDGLPDAVSSSFSANPLTGSDPSTLTITTAAISAPGTYLITLTGTSGSLTHAATFDLVIKPPADFSLAASPISQSISAGGTTGNYTISSKALNGLTGSVDLSVSGLPVGATAHFSATPVSLGTDSQLTISTLNTIATGSFNFTVSANSGSITHSISLTLNVNAVPDFSASLSAVSQSVQQGGTASPYTLTAAPINGFSHDLGLSVTGLPAGAMAVFTPSQITAGTGSSDLTIVTASSTSPGSYPLKIKLDGTTASHTVDATLIVTAAADFMPSATPNSQTIAAGGITGSYKIGVAAQSGFTGQATLSTSGLPTGATASFSANPLAAGANSNLTINTVATLAPGTYSFNVTAVSGSLSHNVPVTLVVTAAPDFAISATPVSRTAMQGQAAGPFALAVSAVNGFVAPVVLTVTGLPAGATATFSATTISGSGTSNLSVATSASTPSGSYSLTVNGTSGSLSHSAVVTLSVTAAAGTVSGKVTNISTGGAVSGATVSYSGGSTLTSSTGIYSFSSVPVGTVNFTATRTGYGSRTNPVGVTAGAATTANFQLATSGKLTGTVKNAAGALISSATVKIVGGLISTSVTLTTNSSGVYLSGWLPVGNYTITVSKTGYTTKSMAATVATGTTSTFNFTMQ